MPLLENDNLDTLANMATRGNHISNSMGMVAHVNGRYVFGMTHIWNNKKLGTLLLVVNMVLEN